MPSPPSAILRIANGAGFWGDNLDAPIRLLESGEIDVLTLEYLAELTLAILSHLRSKDPRQGYVADFPDLLNRALPFLRDGCPPSIVTNGGGLNPASCAGHCATILEEKDLGNVPIGVVSGDDLIDRMATLLLDGRTFDHLETGAPINPIVDRLVSANAYLGAWPIAEALAGGARIVVTGRVADASLTLGPAVHHFGLKQNDWPALAGVSVAGHLIECGAQATGGLWHRWNELSDPAAIGYPIAEISRDGTSTITKPRGSGGLVSIANVAEQLVYEIDDPSCYRTPDVDVDLTSVRLTQYGTDRVRVTESTGRAPSDFYKVAAVYRDGWSASGMLAVVGRDAEAKARAAGRMVIDRVRLAGFELADSLVECLGAGDVVPGLLRPIDSPREVVLRVSVRDPRREAVTRFCRELAPLITSGPPGLAGYASGRPEARPAFGYWPCLVPKADVTPRVEVRSANDWRVR
jgi:hypothetical protein